MVSTKVMIERIRGLVGTKDLNDWEKKFVDSILQLVDKGIQPEQLSSARIEAIERIHNKHFGDN